jgi:hypothetical protein
MNNISVVGNNYTIVRQQLFCTHFICQSAVTTIHYMVTFQLICLFCHGTFYVEKDPSPRVWRASEQIVTLRTPEGREDQDMGSQLVAEDWYHTAVNVSKPKISICSTWQWIKWALLWLVKTLCGFCANHVKYWFFPHLYTLYSQTFYVNDVQCICRMVMKRRKIFLVQFFKYDKNKANTKILPLSVKFLVAWSGSSSENKADNATYYVDDFFCLSSN